MIYVITRYKVLHEESVSECQSVIRYLRLKEKSMLEISHHISLQTNFSYLFVKETCPCHPGVESQNLALE